MSKAEKDARVRTRSALASIGGMRVMPGAPSFVDEVACSQIEALSTAHGRQYWSAQLCHKHKPPESYECIRTSGDNGCAVALVTLHCTQCQSFCAQELAGAVFGWQVCAHLPQNAYEVGECAANLARSLPSRSRSFHPAHCNLWMVRKLNAAIPFVYATSSMYQRRTVSQCMPAITDGMRTPDGGCLDRLPKLACSADASASSGKHCRQSTSLPTYACVRLLVATCTYARSSVHKLLDYLPLSPTCFAVSRSAASSIPTCSRLQCSAHGLLLFEFSLILAMDDSL